MRLSCYIIALILVFTCPGFTQTPETDGDGSQPSVQESVIDSDIQTEDKISAESGPAKPEEAAKEILPKPSPEKKVPAVVNDDKPVMTRQPVTKDVQESKPAVHETGPVLLTVDPEEYRYDRIPGFASGKQSDGEKEEKSSSVGISTEKAGDEKSDKDGLFGYSKKTTDAVMKFSIVFLVFIVFVLYRVRSRKSSGNVLRRYSRK